jgi:hypothetical protein
VHPHDDGSNHCPYCPVVHGTSLEAEVPLGPGRYGSAGSMVAQGLVVAVHPRVVAVDVSHHLGCCHVPVIVSSGCLAAGTVSL